MITSSTCEGETPESARAALIATAPSCGAVTVANAPWKAPTGVRRAAKMTTGSDFIMCSVSEGSPSITLWRQRLPHGTGNQLAAAVPSVARRENFKYFNANRLGGDAEA